MAPALSRSQDAGHRLTCWPAAHLEKREMASTPSGIGFDPIRDHETGPHSIEVAITARRLQLSGFSITEASNLTARLAGLAPAQTGWSLRQVEHLFFLRSIVETGRLEP